VEKAATSATTLIANDLTRYISATRKATSATLMLASQGVWVCFFAMRKFVFLHLLLMDKDLAISRWVRLEIFPVQKSSRLSLTSFLSML